jgi:hypothetical protein
MKSVLVCAKADAEDIPGRADWIAISIRDPGSPPAKLQPGWKAVLCVAFHDKEDRQLALKTGLWKLFDRPLARQCRDFVDKHRTSASGLLVHCGAGASRSPALARAICARLGVRPAQDWPHGNQLVYETMMSAQDQRELAIGWRGNRLLTPTRLHLHSTSGRCASPTWPVFTRPLQTVASREQGASRVQASLLAHPMSHRFVMIQSDNSGAEPCGTRS